MIIRKASAQTIQQKATIVKGNKEVNFFHRRLNQILNQLKNKTGNLVAFEGVKVIDQNKKNK